MTHWNTCNLKDIRIIFSWEDEAKKLITTRDSYINNLTQLDLDCRCHKHGATLDEYLNLCNDSVLEFSDEESFILSDLLCEIDRELKRRGMMLPFVERINIVKTSGDEENNVYGYTRDNTIYICQESFNKGEGFVEHLLVHELFHVLTRNCPEFKKAMYDIIGYTVEDKFFEYPETKLGSFVSNPDVCNQVCHAKLRGGFKDYDCITMTFSYQEYNGGGFHNYYRPYFFPIDENHEFLRDEEGELIVLGLIQVTDSYLEHIGRNTNYFANPEEALAENFVIAVLGTTEDIPNPEIIDSIRKTMQTSIITQ